MLSLRPVDSMKLVDVQAIKALKSSAKYSSPSCYCRQAASNTSAVMIRIK
jgi:hypothetical protein